MDENDVLLNLGINQALLHTSIIYPKIQKLVPQFIVIKVLCFSTIYMYSIIGISQVSECYFQI